MALNRLDNGSIAFTNLVDNNREIGSNENTSVHKPAETACARNGEGHLKSTSIDNMHSSMSDSAKAIKSAFATT